MVNRRQSEKNQDFDFDYFLFAQKKRNLRIETSQICDVLTPIVLLLLIAVPREIFLCRGCVKKKTAFSFCISIKAGQYCTLCAI